MLTVSNSNFALHRCVLSSRCSYLGQKLQNRWKDRRVVRLSNDRLSTAAFRVLLRYLYNGILEFPLQLKDDVIRVLRQCGFHQQIADIESTVNSWKKAKKSKKHYVIMEYEVNSDLETLFRRIVLRRGSEEESDDDEEDDDREDDRNDNKQGKSDQDDSEVSEDDQQEEEEGSRRNGEDDRDDDEEDLDYDIIFNVGRQQFYCHRLFICGRSDYFRALLADHFSEAHRNRKGIVTYDLHTVSKELFESFLLFLYTDSTNLTFDNVYDLLFLSDQYLVAPLKRYCASFIEENIENFNCVELITIARTMMLPKLEQSATCYIANNLDEFLDDDAFKRLVVQDAENVKSRQETDSIDIIDDVRYYLSVSKSADVDMRYSQIDQFLSTLGFEA